jgi:hypothetical protein
MKMTTRSAIQLFSLFCLATFSSAQTREFSFAEDYIRTLGDRYGLELKAQSDMLEAGNDMSKSNMASMKCSQRAILKSREAIGLLTPFKSADRDLIRQASDDIISCYTSMIDNYNNSLSALEELTNATSGSNPNIDIGKLSRRVSEISAKQDYISETFFHLTGFVAMTLIDEVPDENNHVSFLLITAKERKELLNQLESYFGKSVLNSTDKNPKFTVASAKLFKKILTDEHKSADERTKSK